MPINMEGTDAQAEEYRNKDHPCVKLGGSQFAGSIGKREVYNSLDL